MNLQEIDHLYSSLSCVLFYLFEYQSLLFSSHPTYVTNDDVKKLISISSNIHQAQKKATNK